MKLITHLLLARIFRHDFFFKVETGTVRVSPSVLSQVLVTRRTRSNSNHNVTHFTSGECNPVTLQISFLIEPPESGTP